MDRLKKINVLVTGVAGDIGLGVGRILASWNMFNSLYGIDIHSEHPAYCIFDHVDIAPRATETNYIDWLVNHIKEHNIGLLIPTSEAEIKVISENFILVNSFSNILICNDLVVSIGLNKYQTMSYLEKHNIPIPLYGNINHSEAINYPVIVKPNTGQGSKNVYIASSKTELPIEETSSIMWQELLLPDDQEYTCAIFRAKNGEIRTLVLKRKMLGGMTSKGEVICNDDIDNYIKRIAETLKLQGAMNIQLRLTTKGPLLFEINPRLSSTLVFRNKMGFCDLKWWILDKFDIPLPKFTPVKAGILFYRGYQEYIIE